MTDISAKPTLLVTLPLEVLHMVLDHTTKKEQKTLRATNQFLNRLVTALLFESINVYPHIRSFEHLIKAAESPHIGPLIRSLTYDAGYLGVTDMLVRRLQSVYSAQISEEDKKSAIEHARLLHSQSLPIESTYDEIAMTSYFAQAFAHIPNLKHVQVLDGFLRMRHYGGESGRLPSFYAQLAKETCGRFEHTRLERGMLGAGTGGPTYARSLLMALSKLKNPLETFELQRVNWSFLLYQGHLDKHAKFWEKSFGGLKSLELATDTDQPPVGVSAMANLQALLKTATNLEELAITFKVASGSWLDLRDYGAEQALQSVFDQRLVQSMNNEPPVPAKLTWSTTLSKLRLEGLICTKSEIRTVLKQSASTLRELQLDDFVLLPNESTGNRACLVELFKWMQKHLHLDKICLSGNLTNGGMQDWHLWPDAYFEECPDAFVENPKEGTLLDQVQKFVLKGGVNPLEHVMITPGHYDVHKKESTRKTPESLMDKKYSGDDTFSMDYDDMGFSDEDESDLDDDDEDEEEFFMDTEEDENDEDDESDLDHYPAFNLPLNFVGHPNLADLVEDTDSDLGTMLSMHGY